MRALLDEHPHLGVEPVLRELHIPSSTYYRWRQAETEPCERIRQDTELTGQIRQIHQDSGGIYGSPRIHAVLKREGVHVGRKRVERLMRQAGLAGISPRRSKSFTRRDPDADLAPDLVQRDFTAPAPNRLWVTDLTMIPTLEGPLWLSAIRDAFSRRVVAWETSARADADLVPLRSSTRWPAARSPPANSSTMPTTARKVDSTGRRNTLISEVCDVATADWSLKTSDVPEGRRRQWRADRALRPAMRSPGRPDPSRVVQRQFWRLIATGVTTVEASLAVGVSWPVGARWFRHAGGMPPISLAEPSVRYLTFEEREEIAILMAMSKGVREIARALGRDPGTISRELRRNAATRGGKQEYRATVAQWKAQQAAKRPKTAKLLGNDRLREYVEDRLAGSIRRPDNMTVTGPKTPAWKGLNKPHRQDRRWAAAWSPEQISHRLHACLLYTSPSPRDRTRSRMPSSA